MFRYLASKSLTYISTVVILGSLFFLLISKLLTDLLNKHKDPLSINSPLPAVAASAFVFMVYLLSSQLLDDVGYARKNHYHEVHSIENIYLHLTLLFDSEREAFDKLIKDYVNEIINKEWYEMQRQIPKASQKARVTLHEMMMLTYKIKDSYEKNAIRNSMNELVSARVERLRIA